MTTHSKQPTAPKLKNHRLKRWSLLGLKLALGGLILLGILTLLLIRAGRQDPPHEASMGTRYERCRISNVHLVPLDRPTVVSNQVVEVEGNRITAIYDAATAPPNETALEVDGNGAYLMPALIDSHTHIFDRADLASYLGYGVTMVRNMMGFPMHLRWREQVRSGVFPGSQMITATPTLNGKEGMQSPFHKNLSGPHGIEKILKQYQEAGYDFVKIYDGLNGEQFEAIIRASEAMGLKVTGHPPHGLDLETILKGHLVSLEHVEEIFQGLLDYEFDEEVALDIARTLGKEQLPITVTLSAYNRIFESVKQGKPYLEDLSKNELNPFVKWIGHKSLQEWVDPHPDGRDWTLKKYAFMEKLVLMLREHQVPLLLGTDTGPNLTFPGRTLHDEIDLLHALGLAPYEILVSGTRRPSQVFGFDDRGVIREGAEAELVLCEQNPLLHLETLRRPQGVWSNQRYYTEGDLEAIRQLGVQHTGVFSTIGRFVDHLIQK